MEEEEIIVKYAPIAKNVSDIFTKALQKPKYKFFVEETGASANGGRRKGHVVEMKS